MMRKKSTLLRLASILIALSLMLTSNVYASFDTPKQDEWAIPDVISAELENIDIFSDCDIILASGSVKAGNQTFSFSSQIELYRIESEDTQNGKYIANILSSDKYTLINLSLGSPSPTLMSRDENVLSAESVTRIALLDKENNRIFSVEQPSDCLHIAMVQEFAQTVTPADELYETLMQNESWYNNIIQQEIRNTIEFTVVDENELENMNKKSPEAKTDQWVDPEEIRQNKGEYETLKEQNNICPHAAALSATFSPTIDSSIRACVNYVGANKFKTPNTIYQRTPTSSDPTGYYMETTESSCDYLWCIQNNPNCESVETRILGYQIVNMAPKDDPSNSSYTYIRLDIIWNYYIAYYSCHNEIVLTLDEASDFRIRNMRLAMNTDEDSTDFFYRMFANAKTKNLASVGNPAVNLALKVIPGGQYVDMGINVWNALYTVATDVTANGLDGSADKSWSPVPETHQNQMYALTGEKGYNRTVNVDCIQGINNKWLASKGHYIYLDAYVQSTGPAKLKWMQYSYQFEICADNAIGYYYTIKTVDDYFYRSYCR